MKYIIAKIFALACTYLLVSLPASSAAGIGSVFSPAQPQPAIENFLEEGLMTELMLLFFPTLTKEPDIQDQKYSEQVSREISFSHGGPDGGGCFQANNLCEDETIGCPDGYCETQQNCCYDCGCPDVQYCDGNGGDGNTNHWACRDKPANDNLITTFTSGSGYNLIDGGSIYFPEYNPDGNTVNFEYQITEFTDQAGAGVINELCSTDCSLVGGGNCNAGCEFVSCGEHVVDYGDPLDNSDNLMQATNCQLKLTIDQHDPDLGYILTPILSTTMDVIGPPLFQDLDIELSQSMGSAEFASYGCGDGNVNQGETELTCCYDTTCDGLEGNFYCDGDSQNFPDNSCRNLDLIDLTRVSPEEVNPDGLCDSNIPIDMVVKIDNPPAGFSILVSSYTLNGGFESGTPSSVICTDLGDFVYSCPIDIPQNDDYCQGGNIPDITGTLDFVLEFSDNTHQSQNMINLPLSADLPVIDVESFTLADGACQTDLGEGPENSCYDCGCTGNDFCDGTGSPSTYSCNSPPDNLDLSTTSLEPFSFITHPPNSQITFGYSIDNFPLQDTATADSELCENINCVKKNTVTEEEEICEASCSISSCTIANSNGVLEKENCAFDVEITSGYDASNIFTYRLTPNFKVNVNFENLGSGGDISNSVTLGKVLTPDISFGLETCGNQNVEVREDANTCCFDATCNELGGEYYCDTADSNGPSSGDKGCLLQSDIELVGLGLSETDFTDPTIPHVFTLRAGITNKPSGLVLDFPQAECLFGTSDQNIGCHVVEETNPFGVVTSNCEVVVDDGSNYEFTCDLEIPPLDYTQLTDFFDEETGAIVFDGAFRIPVTFNDGSGTIYLQDGFNSLVFGPLSVLVNVECGDGTCHEFAELDGVQACPVDCGCDPVTGVLGDDGTCLELTDMRLSITQIVDDVKNEEGRAYCIINAEGEECTPAGQLIVSAQILNAPDSVNANLVVDQTLPNRDDVIATIAGDPPQEVGQQCILTSANQEYTCKLAQLTRDGRFDDPPMDQVLQKTLNLNFNIEYQTKDINTHQDVTLRRSIEGSMDFEFVEEEREDVTIERTCEEEGTKLDKEIAELSLQAAGIQDMTTLMMLLTIFICLKSKKKCQTAMMFVGMITGPMQQTLSQLQNQISILGSQKADVCDAQSLAELDAAIRNIRSQTMSNIGGTVGGFNSLVSGDGGLGFLGILSGLIS